MESCIEEAVSELSVELNNAQAVAEVRLARTISEHRLGLRGKSHG